MNKKYIIIVLSIILLLVICTLLGFFYHDKIDSVLNGENWNYLEKYKTIKDVQPINSFGKNAVGVSTKNGLVLYKNDGEVIKEEFVSTDSLSYSRGHYSVFYSKDISTLYLIKNSEIVYKKQIKQIPKFVFVNKNGYVTLIYSQVGYKAGVKVLSTDGSEILATDLATSYATVADISSNNKMLYLGEVNSNGIKIKSNIKVINMDTKETRNIEFGFGEIITDLKVVDNNNLIVQTDNAFFNVSLNDDNINAIYTFDSQNTINAFLDDEGTIIIIQKELSNGFNLRYQKGDFVKNIPLDIVPQSVEMANGIIALNFGDEVWIVTNGNIKSKIKVEEALININIIKNNSEIALIYRNKIELVKI